MAAQPLAGARASPEQQQGSHLQGGKSTSPEKTPNRPAPTCAPTLHIHLPLTCAVCFLLKDILKKFNPQILGFSTGTQEETAGLNVAVEGASAR